MSYRNKWKQSRLRHGHTFWNHAKGRIDHTPEYGAYQDAKQRCTNPNIKSYENYGGRGIEFRFASFEEFLEALKTPDNPTGLRPVGELENGRALYSLDRIDNDGHYERGNIRWATKPQQQQNRRPIKPLGVQKVPLVSYSEAA
jgi:hypothetical protein